MKFFAWLKSLFVRSTKRPRSTSALTKARQQVRKDAPETGAYANVAEVLADLDEKFSKLRATKFPKFRGALVEASLVKYAGAYIPCSKASAERLRFDKHIAQTLPSFFLMSFPKVDDSEDNIVNDWLYIIKLKRGDAARAAIEQVKRTEAIYLLGVGLSALKKYPSVWASLAFFAVAPDGTSRELRYKDSWNRWRYTPFYTGTPGKAGETFTQIVNVASLRDWHWSITARKGEYKIIFTIPDNDAPRFFKAREGKAHTRIFHSVTPHPRTLKSGKVTTVKFHYRGRRAFRWNGYLIDIQVPGKHRRLISDLREEAGIELR